MQIYQTQRVQPVLQRPHRMDPDNTRQVYGRDYYDFWESEDRRDDFEEPWYWSLSSVSEDLGTDEDDWYDVARAERMAEAMYEV